MLPEYVTNFSDNFSGDSGHKFIAITYRVPGTHCDLHGCRKALWSVMNPPQALACQKCNFKVHKSCVETNIQVGI